MRGEYMNLPELKIGEKIAKIPIIQGGMGIGVSGSKLAGSVAKEGAVGILSSANIGYKEPDFEKNTLEANLRAMGKEIDKAREISPNGIIGVNIMVATNHYAEMVKKAVQKGIDLIISGAGLPKELPNLIQGSKTKIAPIVSSARAAVLITKMWLKKYNYMPDMIVVEGPEAGGHLGFHQEELLDKKTQSLEEITCEVIEEMHKIDKEQNTETPIIAAGGIFNGNDISKFLKLGASGVQMATRFVVTKECDASQEFKDAYINSKHDDIKIVKSPVGMPGRAIRNEFIQKIELEKEKISKCLNCIIPCNPGDSPYCITKALINSVTGNVKNGLIFCGSNAYKLTKMTTVKELLNELVVDAEASYA